MTSLSPHHSATDRVAGLLAACGTTQPVLPPTTLYNEGWMLRLVLDWFSRQPFDEHPLSFAPGSRWYSEALLPSQFLARSRGDVLAESWTHADGAVGHFAIGARGRGDLHLKPDARQLVVTEAKMFSGLSAGTRRAPKYDQAARNVACIAEVLHRAGRHPASCPRLVFLVLAPAEQIDADVFASSLNKTSIAAKVGERVSAYGGAKDGWYRQWLRPLLDTISVELLSWERVVAQVGQRDPGAGAYLESFLQSCLAFNRPARIERGHRRRGT